MKNMNKVITTKEGSTSTVEIKGNTVIKRKKHHVSCSCSSCKCWEDIFNREVYWLEQLKGFDQVPELLGKDEDKREIYMTYKGEQPKDEWPSDWEDQITTILAVLKNKKCSHNDIRPENLLVDENGKINLIDFGWATEIGTKIPTTWVSALGAKYRYNFPSKHNFNDWYSLWYSVTGVPTSPAAETHILINWFPETSNEAHQLSDEKLKKIAAEYGLNIFYQVDLEKFEKPSKFYNMSPKHFEVEKAKKGHGDPRGTTPLRVYLLEDKNPIYKKRETSIGWRDVNKNIYDLKMYLRKEMKLGYKLIHTSINIDETRNNLKHLQLLEHYPSKIFESVNHAFETLNRTEGLEYVVLRNFEGLPDSVTIGGHEDVDILVNDYFLAKSALDSQNCMGGYSIENGGYRILNNVKIGEGEVQFDIRWLGDNYYDYNWEKAILETRVRRKNFFIPDKENHLYSLIYHAIIQKSRIAPNYKEIFTKRGVSTDREKLESTLYKFMNSYNYQYISPHDKSVRFKSRNSKWEEI